jgi:formamidopyrimidine-DNA glycosylase
MMRIHSLGKRVIAAILFASHSLMSCSTPQLDKQSFQDVTARLIMDVSKHPSTPSSTIEEEHPTLLQASNDSSMSSELEIHAAPSSQALETAPQERESFIARELAGKTFEPRLGQEVTFYKESEMLKARTPSISGLEVYMGEVNLAQGLRPRHIHIVSKEQDKNKKGYVYIDQGGLRGGMMENDVEDQAFQLERQLLKVYQLVDMRQLTALSTSRAHEPALIIKDSLALIWKVSQREVPFCNVIMREGGLQQDQSCLVLIGLQEVLLENINRQLGGNEPNLVAAIQEASLKNILDKQSRLVYERINQAAEDAKEKELNVNGKVEIGPGTNSFNTISSHIDQLVGQASEEEHASWFGNIQTDKEEVIKYALANSGDKLGLRGFNDLAIISLVNHPLFKEKKKYYKEIDSGSNQIGERGVAELAKNLQGTSVQAVNLRENQIGDRGASEFAKNLQGTSVQKVDLSLNRIGASGASEFAKNLQGASVQTVNLYGNNIGDRGAAEFAKNLQGTSVQSVNLSYNKIGYIGAAEFAKNLQGTSVKEVDLGGNQIGDRGAAGFAKNLQGTRVQWVDLNSNNIGARGAVEFAKNLQGTSVQTVDLSSNNIGDKGAAEFAKNLQKTAVHTVDLRRNQIGASGAAEFAKNLQGTSVQSVYLSWNNIGEKGAAEFAKNLKGTSVQTVNLYGNNIGDRGAAEFAKNLQGTSVQAVWLNNNQIGDRGAREFAKNLQGTSVHMVELTHNNIGDRGAMEFAKNLQGTSVQSVNLSYNKIGYIGAVEFAKNLQGTSVQTVILCSNQIGDRMQASLRKEYPHINWSFESAFYS